MNDTERMPPGRARALRDLRERFNTLARESEPAMFAEDRAANLDRAACDLAEALAACVEGESNE
jgi:hypothetical protein